MAVPAGRVIVAFAPADARERFAPHPRHAAQTAIGIAWVAGSFVAVWAAIPEVADRWFKAWGSPIGAWMFLFAAGAWLYLQLAPGRGAIRIAPAAGWTLAATVMAAAYVVTWGTAPQLVRCQLAAAVVGCTMLAALGPKERRGAWGILLLMLLCVHVATSLDFFIGFPLRLVSSELAAAMLGPSVWASGTALSDGSAMYFVDAPCSGVKMLSASLGLGAGLAVLYRLRPMRTIALVPVAFALAIVGNAHRAATLFITHASPDDPVHGFIGVIVFAECAAVLWLAAEWLKRARWAERQRGSVWLRLPAGRLLSVSFIAACFAGAALPVASPSAASVVTANIDAAQIVWPITWKGEALLPAPTPEWMNAWLRDVPGQWAQFTVGNDGTRVLLRYCPGATRKVHSAQNCYLARGGTCTPEDSFRDDLGHVWGRFAHTAPNGAVTHVRECYFAFDAGMNGGDLDDWLRGAESWPDISAWFWANTFADEEGGTLAVTVAGPAAN